MSKILDIKAREVLDSRRNPTKPFTKALVEKRLRTTFLKNSKSSPKNGGII